MSIACVKSVLTSAGEVCRGTIGNDATTLGPNSIWFAKSTFTALLVVGRFAFVAVAIALALQTR